MRLIPKGERQRQWILAQAAHVFSVRGYMGASMDDLTRATGLTKGGIYHYFGSKDALALEAFDFAVDLVYARFDQMAGAAHDPLRRLVMVAELFRSLIDDPVVKGGCPILNAAVEVDDTNPELCARVRGRMAGWRERVTGIVRDGQSQGIFRADISPDTVATVAIATMEGAIMLSKLYDDRQFLDQAVDHLADYFTSL
jgi:TetR/AcrR family transcriptional repressor of nem operon